MKIPVSIVFGCALGLAATAPRSETAGQQEKAAPRPNVLFIAVDDLNHWVGHLGRNAQVRTPHIDRLADRGVAFTRAYSAAPACNPSRAALMSGLRPSTTGVYDNNVDWRPAIPQEITLVTLFRRNGYYAAGAGKIYHGSFDRREEWDDYLKQEGNERRNCAPLNDDDGVGGIKFTPVDCTDERMNDHHIASYGVAQLQRSHDRPFLLTIGFRKPHMPWNVPKKYFDLYPLAGIELPPYREDDLSDVPPSGAKMARQDDHRLMLESGRWKEAVQAYLATITFVDAQIGRLLEALDKSRYRDNTIIVLWGDHGWSLGEKHHWRKFALWEEPTRAPFVWVVPGVAKPGTRSARTVDFMGIYPTLAELCGIPVPGHVEGASIRSLLARPDADWSTPALTTHGFSNHALRSERWRYIRYENGEEELYDHAADPYEWTNLAGEKEHEGVKAELARFFPKVNRPRRAASR